jgi:cytochrome c peroxidase
MNASPRPAVWFRAPTLAALTLGLALGANACGATADDLFSDFCDGAGCAFSELEWSRLGALANLGPAPEDPSNRVERLLAAQQLGQAFYFDKRFSGLATQVDALRRPAAVARAPQGQPTNLSCASCHELGRMGVDVASVPGNVSAGAGWTDVNALATVNSAYQHLFFSNGRVDSLWALATVVAESPTTMNGNRLHTAWVIADLYAQKYNEVFAPLGQPLPMSGPSCQLAAAVDSTGPRAGQCPLDVAGSCQPPCLPRQAANGKSIGCWPPFPLQGKPGTTPGCQPGDPTEPFGDAWDCMDPQNQDLATRVLVNWSKALAAFEGKLVSVDAPFDQFIKEGPSSTAISAEAQRGARLFVGKAGCIDCHSTPLLSDQGFHNVGVLQAGPSVPTEADCPAGGVCDCVAGTNCLPWGAFDGLTKLKASKWLRGSKWSDSPADPSRLADLFIVPGEGLKGAWRTPSLRNVALTAPYMHDGLYVTLEEVVAHYARGGDAGAVGTRAVDIKPLALHPNEESALVAFLRTLTGAPLPPEVAGAPMLPASLVCP